MRCELCGEEIENPREAWREMAGWVDPRKGKGMTGAEPTGKLAHSVCIGALRAGVKVGQETLV